jgi:hypothetical protein
MLALLIIQGYTDPAVFAESNSMKCIPELQQEIVADRMVLFLGAGVSRAAGKRI